MALAIRTHIIPQLLRNNLIVCLHFLIYKLPTNNNGCVLVGWCDVRSVLSLVSCHRVTGNIETELDSENNTI